MRQLQKITFFKDIFNSMQLLSFIKVDKKDHMTASISYLDYTDPNNLKKVSTSHILELQDFVFTDVPDNMMNLSLYQEEAFYQGIKKLLAGVISNEILECIEKNSTVYKKKSLSYLWFKIRTIRAKKPTIYKQSIKNTNQLDKLIETLSDKIEKSSGNKCNALLVPLPVVTLLRKEKKFKAKAASTKDPLEIKYEGMYKNKLVFSSPYFTSLICFVLFSATDKQMIPMANLIYSFDGCEFKMIPYLEEQQNKSRILIQLAYKLYNIDLGRFFIKTQIKIRKNALM